MSKRNVVITLIEDGTGLSVQLESIPPLEPGELPGFVHSLGMEAVRHVEKILDQVARQDEQSKASSSDGGIPQT